MARRRTGFTTRASCLLAAGLTAVLCGVLLGEVDLVRAGVLAAAVPFAAAIVVHRSRVRVANRRAVEPHWAQAGQSVTIHLTITNRSVLPTGPLMLEDQLPDRLIGRARFVLDSLGGHSHRTVSYRMPDLGRGRYRAGPLRVRLSDPFRMIDLVRSFTATSEFVVAPVIDALPPIEPPRSDDLGDRTSSHSVGAHGADDASTREYRTGDDLRKIHWRSSARTGALMVRQEEQPWRAQTTVLLDLRAAAHAETAGQRPAGVDLRVASSLEWAVSAAASIGNQAIRAGRDVGLIADNSVSATRLRYTDPVRYITELATVRPSNDANILPVATLVRSATRDSALVGIFGRLDPAALAMLADAHPRGRSTPAFALLLDTGTWAAEIDEFVVPEPSVECEAGAVILRNAGWRVAVVRRGTSTAEAWRVLLAGMATTSLIEAFR
jgi:uncharacterized protein (DUF58 family)